MNILYKGPITRPCSACSAGDTAMEYHDHDYVDESERVPFNKCVHCDSTFKTPKDRPNDWCYCQCHNEEF